MRTLNYVTATQIAEAIDTNTDMMEARLVTKNKFNQEFLVKLVRIVVLFSTYLVCFYVTDVCMFYILI